jgi:hypothetical protein
VFVIKYDRQRNNIKIDGRESLGKMWERSGRIDGGKV